MTAVQHEIRFLPELLELLEHRRVRHEVIDGQLVVSPLARPRHGLAVTELVYALRGAAPAGLRVFGSCLGVYYGDGNYLAPDVSVVREQDLSEDGVHVAPLLVVEVASPGTWRVDRGRKREIYAELGVPSYWLVDPGTNVVTVLSLRDGAYVEVAAGPRLELTEPFPVTIDLAAGS